MVQNSMSGSSLEEIHRVAFQRAIMWGETLKLGSTDQYADTDMLISVTASLCLYLLLI